MSTLDGVMMHRPLGRVLRLLIGSATATSVDAVVLLTLVWVLRVPITIATVLGCLCGGAVNFALTRAWVFGSRDRAWVAQAVRYFVVVVGGGALVSGAAVAALTALGLPLFVAKAGAIATTMVSWTYPMSARVVFAAPATSRPPPQSSLAI